MSSRYFKSVIAQNEPSTSRCNEQQTETFTNAPTTCIIKDVQTTRRNKWLIKPRSKDNAIKIKVDGKTFFIKKSVLIKHSMLFQKALPYSDKVAVTFCLIGVSKVTFQVIKDWMKDKKNVVNGNNVHQVMDVAEKLEMIDLMNECKQLVRAHGGQDQGTSDSLDFSWCETDDSKLEKRKKKEDQLERMKTRQKEEERRRKEELKLEKKLKKEDENRKKTDEKRRKAEKKRDAKRRKEVEKTNKKLSIDSSKGNAANHEKASTSFKKVQEEFVSMPVELSTTQTSSDSQSSSSSGSKTSTKSLAEVKKTKKRFLHKRSDNR